MLLLPLLALGAARTAPHAFVHPKAQLPQPRLGAPLATLTAVRTPAPRPTVTVSWHGVRGPGLPSEKDWIAMYADSADLEIFTAPILFRYCTSEGETPQEDGTATFEVQNYRSDLVFYYISGDQQFPNVVARSEVVVMDDHHAPLHVHLGYRNGDWLLMWTQEHSVGAHASIAKPGDPWTVVNATYEVVRRSDLCDVDKGAPAGRAGFFPSGHLLLARLGALPPRTTFHYQVGDATSQSQVFTFETGPAVGERVRMALFGDMGQAPADGAHEHSWCFQNHGELPALNTTAALLAQPDYDMVVHFGDIAYATGYLSEWDLFGTLIEPVASRVPWQVSVGNHEMGWSGSLPALDTFADSGGECGVPLLARYPHCSLDYQQHGARPKGGLQQQATSGLWYSFDYGLAHVTMMSSEHAWAEGSVQFAWLAADLASVDRAKTPWVILAVHRPPYVASDYPLDIDTAKALTATLEPLMAKYGVDVLVAGHYHASLRYCRMLHGQCSSSGTWPFLLGAAGYELSPFNFTEDARVRYRNREDYAIGYFDFMNASHAYYELRSLGPGRAHVEVLDTQWMVKEAPIFV